ncbi:MAG TPA: PQQ-dependent sugar dehydrogenase [Pyrinomonadaceae bacterium]|nr:PQQ-dependent sugar dehydrogenase [Pyrinomonadaceae bacterium]
MHIKRSALFLLVTVFVCSLTAWGQLTPPDVIGTRAVVGFLNSPVYATHAGDGTNRMFILEQRGKIKLLQPGATTTTVFLDLTSLVSQSGGERGLLGLAFHPQYSTNRRFFVFYTRQSDGAVEIAEYQTSPSDPNVADPTPLRVILSIEHPAENHNGGTILFGPDGYLYAGIGDGTGGNDSANNAQNINVLLGKFLRIDVNTPIGQVPAYNIPRSNPFAGPFRGRDEIYAYGFRNPYRFSFDRQTGALWVGDVGQEAIEEVDLVTRGGNYGWRVYEGTQCTQLDPSLCIPGLYIPPVLEYSSGNSPRCSVTGGHAYRGPYGTFAPGAYVYADFCTGEVFNRVGNSQAMRIDTVRLVTSIAEDEEGELYLVSLGGTIEKFIRRRSTSDFDGDLRTDVSVFRPSSGIWYILNSRDGSNRIQNFGLNGDIPMPEDYDGDLIADIAVYRPSSGQWYYYRSSDGTVGSAIFGTTGDIPTAGDYDGDLKADLSVYRPSTSTWYVLPSRTLIAAQRTFGIDGDIPVVGDYDGDGRSDMAIFRPANGTWYWGNAFNDGIVQRQFGLNGDLPTQGDFDGDYKTDVAVFRPSEGVWYTTKSLGSTIQVTPWGANGDLPVVGDYDGDGVSDISVFRPANGVWYRLSSSNEDTVYTHFGTDGDVPVPGFAHPTQQPLKK